MSIFKENDSVYDFEHGLGRITELQEGNLTVTFEKYKWPYTMHDAKHRLSFNPYDLIKGGFSQERPKPEIEKGTPVFVKTENSLHWMVGKFYEWHGSGKMVGIIGLDGNTRFYAEYSLENPLK